MLSIAMGVGQIDPSEHFGRSAVPLAAVEKVRKADVSWAINQQSVLALELF